MRVSCVVSSSFPGHGGELSPDAMAWVIGLGEEDPEHDEHAGDDEQRVDDEVTETPRGLAAARGQRAP